MRMAQSHSRAAGFLEGASSPNHCPGMHSVKGSCMHSCMSPRGSCPAPDQPNTCTSTRICPTLPLPPFQASSWVQWLPAWVSPGMSPAEAAQVVVFVVACAQHTARLLPAQPQELHDLMKPPLCNFIKGVHGLTEVRHLQATLPPSLSWVCILWGRAWAATYQPPPSHWQHLLPSTALTPSQAPHSGRRPPYPPPPDTYRRWSGLASRGRHTRCVAPCRPPPSPSCAPIWTLPWRSSLGHR